MVVNLDKREGLLTTRIFACEQTLHGRSSDHFCWQFSIIVGGGNPKGLSPFELYFRGATEENRGRTQEGS